MLLKAKNKMISFIIIGRNEGWKLSKCLKSVFATISLCNLLNCEVVYVDSDSSDDSIERALKFKTVRTFHITGEYNAAIARNIGAAESTGDVLYFVDGDMELLPEFIPLVFNERNELKFAFVSGDFENIYYNKDKSIIRKEKFYSLEKDEFQTTTTGGLFIIKKKYWDKVSGMRTKYRRSQDLDLGIRLSRIGIKLFRKKEIMAKHHTISYKDSNRMWRLLLSGSDFFRVVLLRDHLLYPNMIRNYMRRNYTSLLFLISFISVIYVQNIFVLLPYFCLVLLRGGISMKDNFINIPNRCIYLISRDISLWFALILFWPKEKMEIQYHKVQIHKNLSDYV